MLSCTQFLPPTLLPLLPSLSSSPHPHVLDSIPTDERPFMLLTRAEQDRCCERLRHTKARHTAGIRAAETAGENMETNGRTSRETHENKERERDRTGKQKNKHTGKKGAQTHIRQMRAVAAGVTSRRKSFLVTSRSSPVFRDFGCQQTQLFPPDAAVMSPECGEDIRDQFLSTLKEDRDQQQEDSGNGVPASAGVWIWSSVIGKEEIGTSVWSRGARHTERLA